jgi:hypothetical protein
MNLRTRFKPFCLYSAVCREGVRVPLKVQDIVLQGGDVLLLSCSTRWTDEHRHDKAFVLLQVQSRVHGGGALTRSSLCPGSG